MNGRGRSFYAVSPVLCAAAAAIAVLCPSFADAQSRYDVEYPSINYSDAPTDNRISRLAADLESGAVELEYRPERGYFDSLLEALDIDPSSQTLVYTKTSLQKERIDASTPRGVYFNDDTYVGFVEGSDLVELAAMDPRIGPVFYLLHNGQDAAPRPVRENERCLTCHDTQGMMGGGVPLLMVRSSLVSVDGVRLSDDKAITTTDETPFEDRWGGWYVTGRQGDQKHLGNILVHDADELADLDAVRQGNLDTLEDFPPLDIAPYRTDTSDIVALMVLEHQVTIQDQIAYVKFKAPFVLERTGHGDLVDAATWDALPSDAQTILTRMLDELVDRLLLVDAITLDEPIAGTAGFETWFEAQGPRDEQGRSLRELDLQKRLFKHPLSYLIYSDAFDGLPGFAKDYVYRKLESVFDGSEQGEAYARITDEDRRELREILVATKPDFARVVEASAGG
jgi:hypothetical protein